MFPNKKEVFYVYYNYLFLKAYGTGAVYGPWSSLVLAFWNMLLNFFEPYLYVFCVVVLSGDSYFSNVILYLFLLLVYLFSWYYYKFSFLTRTSPFTLVYHFKRSANTESIYLNVKWVSEYSFSTRAPVIVRHRSNTNSESERMRNVKVKITGT